ncbi:hypothetical protein ACROYT_G014398 [Oculina patagonica]
MQEAWRGKVSTMNKEAETADGHEEDIIEVNGPVSPSKKIKQGSEANNTEILDPEKKVESCWENLELEKTMCQSLAGDSLTVADLKTAQPHMTKGDQAKMLKLSPKFRVGWLNDKVVEPKRKHISNYDSYVRLKLGGKELFFNCMGSQCTAVIINSFKRVMKISYCPMTVEMKAMMRAHKKGNSHLVKILNREKKDSSQEQKEHMEPWSRIQEEVTSCPKTKLETLINEYEEHGDSFEVARVKAENALLPVYRKELRKVLLDYLQWMHAMKKDSTFRKMIETKNELKDTEGYDWLELI